MATTEIKYKAHNYKAIKTTINTQHSRHELAMVFTVVYQHYRNTLWRITAGVKPKNLNMDEIMKVDLIRQLEQFNAKERFYLIGNILGNPLFNPSELFKNELRKVLNVEIPLNVFSAMDYHIDWIYAALCNTYKAQEIYDNGNGVVKGQQEDVDYLVAFCSGGIFHLVFIEAKGVTGWSQKQMFSKIERLKSIFGEDGCNWSNVTPHLVMMSPSQPQNIELSNFPSWVIPDNKFNWIKLAMPNDLNKVTRCNSEGKSDREGSMWRVVSR